MEMNCGIYTGRIISFENPDIMHVLLSGNENMEPVRAITMCRRRNVDKNSVEYNKGIRLSWYEEGDIVVVQKAQNMVVDINGNEIPEWIVMGILDVVPTVKEDE